MIPEQRAHRQRKRHQPPAGVYHAPMTDATRAQIDAQVAAQRLEDICQGVPVAVEAMAYGRERLERMLEPFHFAIILRQRVMTEKPTDVAFIRRTYPAAYDKWVGYLTDAQRERLGIPACDEALLRLRAWRREIERRQVFEAFPK
jgi:hypothetical protein